MMPTKALIPKLNRQIHLESIGIGPSRPKFQILISDFFIVTSHSHPDSHDKLQQKSLTVRIVLLSKENIVRTSTSTFLSKILTKSYVRFSYISDHIF